MSALLPQDEAGSPGSQVQGSALLAAQLSRKDGERRASAFWGHIAKHPVSGPTAVHTEASPAPRQAPRRPGPHCTLLFPLSFLLQDPQLLH